MMRIDTAANKTAVQKTAARKTLSTRRRRFTRAAGWALVIIGVVVSWIWSVELTILGESVRAALSGAAMFILLGAGIALIRLASPHRGRRARTAFLIAIAASAIAAIVAGVVPVAVTAATTGTVTANITSGTSASGYSLSDVALITSDRYGLTNLSVTLRANDRTTPLLEVTVSFTDGSADLTCFNTRQMWTHLVSTVSLSCDDFSPISSLKTVSGIAVVEK